MLALMLMLAVALVLGVELLDAVELIDQLADALLLALELGVDDGLGVAEMDGL